MVSACLFSLSLSLCMSLSLYLSFSLSVSHHHHSFLPPHFSLPFISFSSPFYFDRVFLYNPNWPGTHYVGHDVMISPTSNNPLWIFFFFCLLCTGVTNIPIMFSLALCLTVVFVLVFNSARFYSGVVHRHLFSCGPSFDMVDFFFQSLESFVFF